MIEGQPAWENVYSNELGAARGREMPKFPEFFCTAK